MPAFCIRPGVGISLVAWWQKMEWHNGELFHRVGFIVTNLERPAKRVRSFATRGHEEKAANDEPSLPAVIFTSCCLTRVQIETGPEAPRQKLNQLSHEETHEIS